MTSRTVNGTTATLSYDGLDNLTKYDAGSNGQEQYVYGASGERVLRRSTSAGNTSMTVYAFGLEERLYSGSGVNQGNTYYYMLGGLLIGEFDGANTNMFLTDALGSVIETISAAPNTASVQGNQVYSPYGSSRYQQGSMGTTKGFTGQYNDSVSGLDYYGARYYDPVVGRFLSADKAQGNGTGMDPYAYVGGNPETFSDPTGQFYASPPGGGGGNPALTDPQDCYDGCDGGGLPAGAPGGGDSSSTGVLTLPPGNTPSPAPTPPAQSEPWYVPVVRIAIGIAAAAAYVSGQVHSWFTHPSSVDAAESINLVLPLGINSVGWAHFHRSVGAAAGPSSGTGGKSKTQPKGTPATRSGSGSRGRPPRTIPRVPSPDDDSDAFPQRAQARADQLRDAMAAKHGWFF